jgi:hypothetical protein
MMLKQCAVEQCAVAKPRLYTAWFFFLSRRLRFYSFKHNMQFENYICYLHCRVINIAFTVAPMMLKQCAVEQSACTLPGSFFFRDDCVFIRLSITCNLRTTYAIYTVAFLISRLLAPMSVEQ